MSLGEVMKLIVLVIAMAMVTENAWAILGDDSCRVYEYKEMNDMTDQELKHEIELTRKKVISNLKYGNKIAAMSGSVADKEAQNAYKKAQICGEQSSRLLSEKTKRPNYAATQERAYEDSIEEIYFKGFPDTRIYERLFKDKKQEEITPVK
jgi:hypothetical protein